MKMLKPTGWFIYDKDRGPIELGVERPTEEGDGIKAFGEVTCREERWQLFLDGMGKMWARKAGDAPYIDTDKLMRHRMRGCTQGYCYGIPY